MVLRVGRAVHRVRPVRGAIIPSTRTSAGEPGGVGDTPPAMRTSVGSHFSGRSPAVHAARAPSQGLVGVPAPSPSSWEDTIPARQPHPAPRGFRQDIQGLRAVAVALVVVFHIWPDLLTGGYVGVDVFFVISGYLITAHLLARPPRGVRDLGTFWARRIHRLLPAALTVLVVTAAATRLLAPSTQWAATAKEILASAFYVQNWLLAGSSVDYHAGEQALSPVQHYWSLSIEEQFYLAWPLLILTAFFVSHRSRRDPVLVVRCVIATMIILSLAASVWLTLESPASAYFVTPTRMWELAVGGMVATVGVAGDGRAKVVAVPVAWLGLAGVVVSGVTYTGETLFPGYTALLPVLGTAAVIWAGSQHPLSPTGVFRVRPVQWLGDVSYSVYLWHWPLVVLLPFASGGTLGLLDQSAIVVATLVLAGLTKTYVEDRFRHPRPAALLRHSYRAAVAGMGVVALFAAVQIGESRLRTAAAEDRLAVALEASDPCLGAGALVRGEELCPPVPDDAELVPAVELAADDKSQADADDCFTDLPFAGRRTCTYGDGPTQVALVGNSHAGHWLPALQIMAERNDWTITTYLVFQCTFTDARQAFPTQEATQGCYDYGQWVQEQTAGDRYDLVITSERQSVPIAGETLASSRAKAVTGYASYLRDWARGGTNILVIKDPTSADLNIPDCLADHPDDHDRCSGPRDEWVVDDALAAAADELDLPRVSSVSFDDLVCGVAVCEGAIGGVVAYYDRSHLTATYVSTMAPHMAEPIERALARSPID